MEGATCLRDAPELLKDFLFKDLVRKVHRGTDISPKARNINLAGTQTLLITAPTPPQRIYCSKS